jgi:peptidoglycan-associated lipoprotein
MRQHLAALLAVATVALTGCPPTYPNCKSDENCTEKGEVCVQGQCRECATTDNCKPGFVCEANKCTPKPECGFGAGECGTGKKCSSGKCVVDPNFKPAGSCTANEDCPSGQECKAGRCAAVETKGAPTCTFEPVRFDFNEYSLTGAVQSSLSQYADCIKKGALRFTLEGHADERGTEEFNMVLSQKRAASVRKYLIDLGVPAGSLDTVGFGENKPAMNGSGEDAWAANRRVEFKAKK